LSFAQTGGFFSTTFNINSLLGAANYKGGIVVTEDDNSFSLYGGTGYKLIDAFGYATPNQLRFYASNAEQYRIGASGVFNWYDGAGGTRMTLNSTGLGVGVSPATKLDVRGTINGNQAIFTGTVNRGLVISTRSDGLADDRTVILNAQHSTGAQGQLVLQTVGTDRLLIDSSGNVGIGVTPSAWFSTWKVLQLAGGSFGGPSDRSFLLQNAIVNPGGNFQYVSGSSTPASGYRQFNGAHDWYTAAAGTSPNTITDFSSPKMTLDESGNLILLSSNTPATLTTNGQLTVNATSNTNLRFSYRGSDGVTRTANITLA
jgi:hypothetical protein